uniref:Uncharacterized protein n=1 Tax=Arundo donax TaxID=35708 RepID=A0A0A9GRD2_ARUDO
MAVVLLLTFLRLFSCIIIIFELRAGTLRFI